MIKNILNILFNLVFYTFLISIIIITIVSSTGENTNEATSILGYRLYTVLTGSMSPTMDKGTLIIVKETNANDIKKEDVITFYDHSKTSVTTHRVKDIVVEDGTKFITQGDANNTIDPNPIESEFVVGKVVFYIPIIGATMQFIKSNFRLLIAI